MTCPICDQKPMNCDCTETERRQWSEIEDLRLTDEERDAVAWAAEMLEVGSLPRSIHGDYSATLRGLLERTLTTHANPDDGSVQDSEKVTLQQTVGK